jgi:hypothetical protein
VAAVVLAQLRGGTMNRTCLDPRVWGPALAGLLLVAPRALPPAAAPTPPRPPSVELPALHPAAPATSARQLELVPERSSVRLLAAGPRGELLVDCPAVSGELELDAGGRAGDLTLRIDLAALRPVAGYAGPDLHHVLGVHGTGTVVYHGRVVATTDSDLPGVRRLHCLGRLHFGDRVRQQAMELWQCCLAGQPMRLQGHGTVPGEDLGLPERRWLGLVREHHDVTLGLDLAWRRRRER